MNQNAPEDESLDPRHSPDVAIAPGRSARLKVVLALTLFPVALLFFSLFGRFSFFAELICNFRFQLILAVLTGAIVMALLGGYRWAVSLVLVCLLFGSTVFSNYLPRGVVAADQVRVGVLSFNIYGLNETPGAVLDLIDSTQADVVILIEYTSDWVPLCQGLQADYPYRIEQPRWHGFGIALFSKYPVLDSSIFRLAPSYTDSPMIVASLDVGAETPMRVAATHLLAPMGYTRLAVRNQQIEELTRHLPAGSDPTVLLGDFNCVPWSPFLQEMLSVTGLHDSRRGFGYQGSWPSDFWPMRIPIDQAFVSDNLQVIDRQLLTQPTGSDHFPLWLELGW
ncbi:MAG: endonuclease/exonuclease/phosphatase family protein [Mariniblastus sp.]|nr:endonuclease/exonuclease/phosphatase family protein [Mariniblastus sp.]